MTRYNRTDKAPDQELVSPVAVKMSYRHMDLFPRFCLSLTATVGSDVTNIYLLHLFFFFPELDN